MEEQIKELVKCVKTLTREVAQLKEVKAERRIREEEIEAREKEAREEQETREDEEIRSLEKGVEDIDRRERKKERCQEENDREFELWASKLLQR